MPQSSGRTHLRLTTLWERADVPALPLQGDRYAVMSDFHLGDGRGADDCHHNESVLMEALAHYIENGYHLILLGDIEELWQFNMKAIIHRYGDTVYARLRAFGRGRIHRVFGNHDIDWAAAADPLWGDAQASTPEALKLVDERGEPRVLLVHGHQGSVESDRFARQSRPLVRLFRFMEPLSRGLGLYRNPATTTFPVAKKYERIMHTWARAHRVLLVCGHSHRAVFASRPYASRLREQIADLGTREGGPEEALESLRRALDEEIRRGRDVHPTEGGVPPPCYFNCGCALYSDGITALEIADGEIRLVKWGRGRDGPHGRQVYQMESLASSLEAIRDAPTMP